MITLHEFLAATGGTLLGQAYARAFAGFAYDSRIVEPGQLFLAVVTETGNGHDYIPQACQAGATGIVCQHPPDPLPQGVTIVRVENTQQALQDYARHILAARDIEVIGITGSTGKTSTKEAVASVLATRYAVFRNPGNYNGRFGLPIALGLLTEAHRLAVLEMACDSLDEIRDLANLTKPRVGVVTQVSHSHMQYLGSLDDIAREKGRLVESLPAKGVAVLNHDDERVRRMAGHAPQNVLRYGLSPAADLYADQVTVSANGVHLQAHWQGAVHPLHIPLVGAHHAYTALAAAAVGLIYGLSWDEIACGLAQVQPQPGRTRLLQGVKGSTLLDDSYNASPVSALAALETLASLPAARRIAVLGDMAELGAQAEEGHRHVGRRCAEAVDLLVTKGDLARLAAEEALAAGMPPGQVHITYTAQDATRHLLAVLQPGDLVLLKGSAEARMEHITAELLAEPESAGTLLPRQNRGWAQVQLQRPGRPTWVEVDLEAVRHNVRHIVDLVGPTVEVMAVLKADGYGHGAIKVARTALNNGAHWLGVACLGEALALRGSGITAPILVLGYTPPWQAREALLHDVATTLFSLEAASALSRAGIDLGRTAQVHVKVDTGMGRLGLLPEETLPFFQRVCQLPALHVDGVFTHMAAADEEDLAYTRWQLGRFEAVLADLRGVGLLPPRIHAANSAALLRLPESHYNMVRPGLAIYGLNPCAFKPDPPETALPSLRPALAFKCQVAQVKELPAGSFVSYGRTFCTARPSRIAVIPVGYADGFRRAPHHWGEVLVHGRRAPIVGRVCMDQTMVDVTEVPGVRSGDEVVLIGSQGAESISVEEVARQLGTISYEVVSEILARVPRIV
ncbi:MAG: alanine racemase [Anaerolineae bacterium]